MKALESMTIAREAWERRLDVVEAKIARTGHSDDIDAVVALAARKRVAWANGRWSVVSRSVT